MEPPEWLDTAEYPFTLHRFAAPDGQMHYVDEGTGSPVVFLHGNPDWSFSYRKVMLALKDDCRCIAPDHLGFGLSEKPGNYAYQPWQLATNLEALLINLDLKGITLVMNDWGGPIGIDFALRNPDRVQNLVIMNTWCWPLNSYPAFWLFSRLMSGKSGQWLTGRFNLFSGLLVWLAVHRKQAFTGAVHRQYQAPYASAADRQASIALPYYLMAGKDWFATLRDKLPILSGKPVALIWGLQDPAFGKGFLRTWQSYMPEARVLELPHAGHFPQECEPGKVADQIRQMLANPTA